MSLPNFMIYYIFIFIFRFFFFQANTLVDRLTYVVTNMLTVVAFFFIMNAILPQIPYLTLIDKYMNAALIYIVLIGIACVVLNAYQVENSELEDAVFYACIGTP